MTQTKLEIADSTRFFSSLLGGGVLGFFSLAAKQIYDTVIEPFDLNISKYVRTSDYKQRVGFLDEFETDFKIVLNCIH